jgi:hypothetical protein
MTEADDDFKPRASLHELLEEAIPHLTGVERTTDGATTFLSRSGQAFAAIAGEVLELRLDPLISGAALRTADTSASARGEGWIRFAPAVLDRFAVDRVGAWLGYAWRHALE